MDVGGATVVLHVIVGLLMLVGLVGAALPFVPGTPLILAGAILYAVSTDFTPVGPGRLVLLAALALVGATLTALAGMIGTRRAGGSRRATIGALLGLLVGLVWAPIGLLLGPVLGAIVGELSSSGRLAESVRVGVGTLLGLLLGAVAHVAVAAAMVGMFAWWVWRG
jgi:uncharacterized protein